MDVKPNSCPNSVNPNSEGVLPVTAGWPYFEPGTVELIPVKVADYEPKFDEYQDWSDPVYGDNDRDDSTVEELCQLVTDTDRSASPISMRNEDVDGDGDLDT